MSDGQFPINQPSPPPRGAQIGYRFPLVYEPSSTTRVNVSRLPPAEQLRGMQLSYRERPLFRVSSKWPAWSLPFLVPLAVFLLYAARYYLSARFELSAVASCLWAVGTVAVASTIFAALAKLKPAGKLLDFLWNMTVIWTIVYFVPDAPAMFTKAGDPSVVVPAISGALAALGAYLLNGPDGPIHIWRQSMLSHPMIEPALWKKESVYSQNAALMAAGAAGAFVGYAVHCTITAADDQLSILVTVALLAGIALALFDEDGREAIPLYLLINESPSGAPGVWLPSLSAQQRRNRLLAAFALLALGLLPITQAIDLRTLNPRTVSVQEMFASDPTMVFVRGALLYALFAAPISFLALAVPMLATRNLKRRITKDLQGNPQPLWAYYVKRLINSTHQAVSPDSDTIREAEHLFLGAEPDLDFPILLDRKLLKEHCYIMGDSGSGKTSLGIMPLLTQIAAGHILPDGSVSKPNPTIIIDLKGDPALFHSVKHETEAKGRKFLFFTPEKGRASYCFNPFDDFNTQNRTEIQLCHLLLDALSLNHGEGYGRTYYSRRNRQLLLDALNHPNKPKTFDELYTTLEQLLSARQGRYDDAFELVATVQALSQYPQLVISGNQPPSPDHTIHMPKVLEENQVVYFWLPALVESISAAEIAKLAVYALINAAIDRQYQNKENRQVYLVIDEFQRMAGENFRIILEQARSFGISVILSNQSLADLKLPTADLRPTVRTNTRVKMFFSVAEPNDIRMLSDLSGEDALRVQTLGIKEVFGLFRNTAVSQTLTEGTARRPRLSYADIQRYSDCPTDFILHVSRGGGYTQFYGQPVPVRGLWPYSLATYKQFLAAAWPTGPQLPVSPVTPKARRQQASANASARRNQNIHQAHSATRN